MSRSAIGVDVGRRSAKALRGHVKGNGFVVTEFAFAANPTGELEDGWRALPLGSKPRGARVGVGGREVNVRYTRVPRVPDWQLRKLMRFETEEIAAQSEAPVAADFNVLPEIPEIEGEDVVLLAMARESLLEHHLAGLSEQGGSLDAFTPNAIALYNAWLRYGVVMEDTVLVADVGHESVDVILARGTDLLFARNLSGGAKLFDDALCERFGVSPAKADEIKRRMASLDPARTFDDPTAEKASRALLGPAGQILSLLQSTVVFCKSQVKLTNLKLDRVMLCGGGAALDGLDAYLRGGLGVPVERFDPFQVVDASGLDPAAAAELEEHRLEAVVALGLATTASDPDAYGIEILPARVARRRELVHGTSFLVATAVLAALFLGLFAWRSATQLDEVEASVARLGTQVRRSTSVDREARALVDENRALAAHAGELFALVGAGEQLLRVLEAIDRELPPSLWIEELTSTFGHDEALGVPRGEERPILRLRGRAEEGTEPPAVRFGAFVERLRAALPEARIVEQLGATGDTFAIALTMLGPPPSPDAVDPQEGP